jgi:hypothetical protein
LDATRIYKCVDVDEIRNKDKEEMDVDVRRAISVRRGRDHCCYIKKK